MTLQAVKSAFAGATSLGQVRAIDPATLTVFPQYNVRDAFTLENPRDRELYDSIKLFGFNPKDPIIAAARPNGQLGVIRGHRRLAAVMLLRSNGVSIATVPVMLETKGVTDEEHDRDLIKSNNGGVPLTLAEIGIICERRIKNGQSVAQVAASLQLTPRHVLNARNAAKLDPRLKSMVAGGLITAVYALDLQAMHGSKVAGDIAEEAKNSGQTRASGRKSAQIAREALRKAEQKRAAGTSPAADKQGKGKGAPPAPPAPSNVVPMVPSGTSGAHRATLLGPLSMGKDGEILDGQKLAIGYGESVPMAREMIDLMNAAFRAGLYVPPGKGGAKSTNANAAPGPVRAAAATRANARKSGK